MIHYEDMSKVFDAMHYAEKKHPEFPRDIIHMAALVSEEAGEAIREANNGDIEKLKHELIQTIQVSFRALHNIRKHYGKT